MKSPRSWQFPLFPISNQIVSSEKNIAKSFTDNFVSKVIEKLMFVSIGSDVMELRFIEYLTLTKT